MKLHGYFENTEGIGILATADSNGIVNTAVYARPHFIDEENCIFLMADKRSHKNIQENPYASYIFIEQLEKYKGKRLYLKKIKESKDSALANNIRRNKNRLQVYETGQMRKTFVVYFKVNSVRPLIGDIEAHTQKNDICPTCLQKTEDSGHLCVPFNKNDEKCSWCGSLILNERHLCDRKVKDLAYICNSCGRTAVHAENLCYPQKIN